MRCTGRLAKAELPTSVKHPILLEKDHYITSLIVEDSHKRVMHGGVKSTLTELRARFWIIQGRQLVRKLLYKCMICRKLEGRPYQATTPPPLPEFWVKECSPFPYTVVDFAGPLYRLLCQKSFWPYVKNHSASKLVVLPQLLIWISYPALQLPHSWEVSEDSLPIEAPPPPVWWWLIMGKPSGQKCEKSWNWWTTREWNNTLPMHGWSGRLIWKGPLVG